MKKQELSLKLFGSDIDLKKIERKGKVLTLLDPPITVQTAIAAIAILKPEISLSPEIAKMKVNQMQAVLENFLTKPDQDTFPLIA